MSVLGGAEYAARRTDCEAPDGGLPRFQAVEFQIVGALSPDGPEPVADRCATCGARRDTDTAGVKGVALAESLGWERSRLSHQVARMERAGLVRREECDDDARGTFVVVTAPGRAALDAAVPAHVALVRRLVVDALDPADLERLGAAVDTVLARIAEP